MDGGGATDNITPVVPGENTDNDGTDNECDNDNSEYNNNDKKKLLLGILKYV